MARAGPSARRATRPGLRDHWDRSTMPPEGASLGRRTAAALRPGWGPMPGAQVASLMCLAQRRGLRLGGAAWSRPVRVMAWGAGRAGRCAAGRWRQAAAPEAVSNPTQNRCAAGRSCEAVGSRVEVAWTGGAGRHDEAWCQNPPNKGLQATANSLRSCLALAISGA